MMCSLVFIGSLWVPDFVSVSGFANPVVNCGTARCQWLCQCKSHTHGCIISKGDGLHAWVVRSGLV